MLNSSTTMFQTPSPSSDPIHINSAQYQIISNNFQEKNLQPQAFKVQFLKELRDKVDPSELANKYKKYFQDPEYCIRLFRNMKKWIKEIYPQTQKEILDSVHKITQQIYNFINDYQEFIDENKDSKSYENLQILNNFYQKWNFDNSNNIEEDLQQLYQLEININALCHDNKTSVNIFNLMLHLSQAAIPVLNIKIPKTLNEQQIDYFQEIVRKIPRLKKKFSTLDSKTIDGNQKIQDKINRFLKDFESDEPIKDEKLMQILFDLIKQQQNFQFLIDKINEIKNKVQLTQLILQIYVIEHADYDLKVLLCRDFSKFMPMPFAFYNPWSQSQLKNMQILDPIYYIFEKDKSVIQIKLPKQEKTFLIENKIKGCTHLLNKLFGRDFSENNNNLINYGQAEIQFDQDCANIEHWAIVDFHGFPNFDILTKVFPLFDVFIIHLHEDCQSEYLNKILEQISNNENTLKTVILIKHNCSITSVKMDEIKSEKLQNLKIFEIKIRNLISTEGNVLNEVIKQFHKILFQFFSLQSNYKKNPNLRLSSKKKFLDLLQKMDLDRDNLCQDAQNAFSEILKQILNEQNLKGKNFLPVMNLLKEKKQIEEEISDQNCLDENKIIGEKRIKQIEQIMEKQEASQITKLISDSINKNQCLRLLPFLSSVIKDYLEDKNKILDLKKENLQEELFKIETNQNKQQIDDLQKEIDEIKNQIENNCFSIEMIFTEIQNLAKYSKESSITRQDYNNLIKLNDINAQPQQIIDGETLICFADFLKNLSNQINNNEELSIYSVIGPQSSGKSLLLNKIFGTSFLSASGRCTKGVYFSIIRYKVEGKMKKILILDTEGIQSVEGKDAVFDKRLIYFAIGVSHAVFICNKQEINSQMSETIKFVAEAMSETKTTIVKDPSIFIILNMCTNIADETILQSANQIKEELQIMEKERLKTQDENQKNFMNSIIKIKTQNIIKLGQAFNKIPFGPNNMKEVNKPNYDFAVRTNEIKYVLTQQQFEQIQKGETTRFSLLEFFEQVDDFWSFSKTSRQLSDYQNLKQKGLDIILIDYIKQEIKKTYIDNCEAFELMVKNECTKITQKHKNGNEINFDEQIFDQISGFIRSSMLQIDGNMITDYERWCKDKGIDQPLMEKRKLIFFKARAQAISRAITLSQNELHKFVGEKTQLVGSNLVREYAQELLSKNEMNFNEELAKKLFEPFWPTVQAKVKKLQKDHQTIQKETEKDVILQFYNHLSLTLKQDEKEFFNKARTQSEEEWLENIMQHFFKKVLVYSGNQYGLPKIKTILKFQNETYQYLDSSKTLLFEQKTIYTKLKWWDLLQSVLNVEKIANEIKDYVKSIIKPDFISKLISLGNPPPKESLEKILKQLKDECEKLGFGFKLDSEKFIQQMQIQKLKGQTKILNSIKQIFKTISNFNCQEDFDLFRQSKWEGSMKHFKFLINDRNSIIQKFIEQINQLYKVKEGEKIFQNSEINISKQIKQSLEQPQDSKFPFNHKNFEIYLNFMKDTQKQTNLTDQQAASTYFFRIIKWKEVFKKIQQEIIKRFNKYIQKNEENSIQRFIQSLDQKSVKRSDLSQIDQEHALTIVIQIRDLIQKINNELKPLRMEISDIGETFIFLITQIYTQQLVEKLEILRQDEVLETFETNKISQEEWFVAYLTARDSDLDNVNGKTAAKEINQYFIEKSNYDGIKHFQQELSEKEKTFERLNYLKLLQDEVIDLAIDKDYSNNLIDSNSTSVKELISYYIQPRDFLTSKMDQKIKKLEIEVKPLSIEHQKNSYDQNKDSLIKYFKNLKQSLEEITKSNDLFYLEKDDEFKKNISEGSKLKEYNRLQKIVRTNYLHKLINNQRNNNQQITVEGWNFLPRDQLPMSESLNQSNIKEGTSKKLASIINEIKEINDLQDFIKAFIENLEQAQRPKELESSQLMEQRYHQFCKIFIGCLNVCPMCRKQCDFIHEEVDNMKHGFENGACHQFIGFGGTKTKHGNIAITNTCNDIRDDQFVTVDDNLQKWSNVKINHGQFKNWNFNQGQSQNQRAKQVRIWNLIGKDLCDRYNQEKGLNIQFQKADDQLQKYLGQVHFILMLDASGSMDGGGWQNLINAVYNFLKTLEQNEQYKLNSKITCITFSDDARVSFSLQNPSSSLWNQIQYIGEGTNFSDPFEKAYQICENQSKNFDKTVIYFMTDGYAEDPKNAICKFRQNKVDLKQKLAFYAVGYGTGCDLASLGRIAQDMGGKLKKAPTAADLENSFQEIIINVFENNGSS